MQSNDVKVWVEKYRPQSLNDMVLDHVNEQILSNILKTGNFPNLMLYGPPGTGKTTAIINLIHAYQERWNSSHVRNKELVIHLNASDERGIDVIRNQIISFVETKPLFRDGKKFVVLDEVDYMTKNAQQALRYLLQGFTNSRFCLICNYMSKIDTGLQTEFVLLRFNQLPKEHIAAFLTNICTKEKLALTSEHLSNIQQMFSSDIRSMINYIQTNQLSFQYDGESQFFLMMDDSKWTGLFNLLLLAENNAADFIHEIFSISKLQQTDAKTILKSFLNFVIRNHSMLPDWTPAQTTDFFAAVEYLMHNPSVSNDTQVAYIAHKLKQLFCIQKNN
jgi:DNA polymerase III delta prime subunit